MNAYDPVFFPFYANLTPAQKELYKHIYEQIKRGEKTIPVSAKCTSGDLDSVIKAIHFDRPAVFWFEGAYSFTTLNENVTSVSPKYNDLISNIPKYSQQLKTAMNSLLGNLSGKNVLQKELCVHDRLADKISYQHGTYDQSAYSALVLKKSVCAGYSRAFQLIMQMMGVPCYYCHGMAKADSKDTWGLHAWNIIKLGPDYYAVDLTWNDCYNDSKHISYKYFNSNETIFSQTHKKSDDCKQLPKCNGTKYNYKYITGVDPDLQIIYQSGVTYKTVVCDKKSYIEILSHHMKTTNSKAMKFSFPVRGDNVIKNAKDWFKEAFRQVYGDRAGYSFSSQYTNYNNGYYLYEISITVKI